MLSLWKSLTLDDIQGHWQLLDLGSAILATANFLQLSFQYMALAFRNQFYLQKSVTITSADPDLMSSAVKLMSRKN